MLYLSSCLFSKPFGKCKPGYPRFPLESIFPSAFSDVTSNRWNLCDAIKRVSHRGRSCVSICRNNLVTRRWWRGVLQRGIRTRIRDKSQNSRATLADHVRRTDSHVHGPYSHIFTFHCTAFEWRFGTKGHVCNVPGHVRSYTRHISGHASHICGSSVCSAATILKRILKLFIYLYMRYMELFICTFVCLFIYNYLIYRRIIHV